MNRRNDLDQNLRRYTYLMSVSQFFNFHINQKSVVFL